MSGPGRIGASNLGNTCYVNSVVQASVAAPCRAVPCEEGPQGLYAAD